MNSYPVKMLFMSSLSGNGTPIIVDVLGENKFIAGGFYIRYPGGGSDTTKREFLFALPDEVKQTEAENNRLKARVAELEAASAVVPVGLADKALELCCAVENKEEFPPAKFAIRCLMLINQVRKLASQQPSAVVPDGLALVPLELAAKLAVRWGCYGVDELFAQTRVDAITELNEILNGAQHPSSVVPKSWKNCANCGTHEVEIFQQCQNSICESYADEVSLHKGWEVDSQQPSAAVPEPFGTESAYQTAKDPILSSSNMIISCGLVRELVEALRNSLSNASVGSLQDCCCGETEQAWRLCPLHSTPAKQEQESCQ